MDIRNYINILWLLPSAMLGKHGYQGLYKYFMAIRVPDNVNLTIRGETEQYNFEEAANLIFQEILYKNFVDVFLSHIDSIS